MTRLAGVACVLVLAVARDAGAQAAQATPSPVPRASAVAALERNFFRNLLQDQKAIWTSPVRAENADLAWIAPLAAGTFAFIATDRDTGDAVARHPELVDPSRVISAFGSAGALAGASAGFYLVGRLSRDDRARETGILGGQAVIDSLLVAAVIKAVTARARPDAGDDRGRFWAGGTSFPSGHAVGSWAIAVVIAREYGDNRAVQIAAYSAAALISVSRFTAQRHYLSDILVGSALGYGIGHYVFRTHHVGASASPPSRWPLVSPHVDRHARAFGVTLAWVY
jgi:membrane-associated phospholipid phosphatase